MPPGGQHIPPGGQPMQPGFGAYPPPPPPPPRRNNKVALIAGAAVLAVAGIVGVVVATSGNDDKGKEKEAKEKPSASAPKLPSGVPSIELPSPSGSPGQGAPVGGETETPDSDASSTPSSGPTSSSPTDVVPYVVLSPGTCFDHPGLDPSVKKVERRSCTGPHDGEVISNATLTGTFTTEKEIQSKALSLCESAAKVRMKNIPVGKTYYYYALYPAHQTYTLRGEDQVSCSLTLSSTPGGPKLTEKLPK
ncbi:hypothetical protein ACMA1D_02760 [Streptomyces sp. 796.1]|uniref:hypothetical protein n=1 Tax=Streptomyces sp. 796.1 TaxID=3163029 RepID=UPI0039C902D8